MKVFISPSRAVGKCTVPPSKSMAHRALICAALSKESCVSNIGYSQDITVTLDCLEKMGAKIRKDVGKNVIIGSLDPKSIPDGTSIYCHESGSTLRFLIPICMLGHGRVTISGTERLMQRPLSVYEDFAHFHGIDFFYSFGKLIVGSGLTAGDYKIPGNVSSQFVTGLLFALSCINEKSTLTVTDKFESSSYINLTLSVLRDFGKDIKCDGRTYTVMPNTHIKSTSYTVEGDWSGSAFLDAFNLIGGDVKLDGLREDSLQGDSVYRKFYYRLNHGFDTYDLSNCPDLAPILFVLASMLNGGEFTGTARLKIKESDRAEAMREELEKIGADIHVEYDRVIIKKAPLHAPTSAISSHNDHRIAMAMSVALSLLSGEIDGAEAVEKSFPNYWETLEQLQIGLKKYD